MYDGITVNVQKPNVRKRESAEIGTLLEFGFRTEIMQPRRKDRPFWAFRDTNKFFDLKWSKVSSSDIVWEWDKSLTSENKTS